jgi:Tfp pilus assembly major pilin PilA
VRHLGANWGAIIVIGAFASGIIAAIAVPAYQQYLLRRA